MNEKSAHESGEYFLAIIKLDNSLFIKASHKTKHGKGLNIDGKLYRL